MRRRVVIVVFAAVLVTACTYTVIMYYRGHSASTTKSTVKSVQNIDDKVSQIEELLNRIDNRISQIKELLDYDWDIDYNDGDILTCQHFCSGVEGAPLTESNIDEQVSQIEELLDRIDERVSLVKERINTDWYNEYYEDDIVIYRHFINGVEGETLTGFYMYYDEEGKLVFAEIIHYRAANYSIYFHNNVLLHIEVGPFSSGGMFINGDINDVQVVTAEDPMYTFVLEDLAFCLSHAYL